MHVMMPASAASSSERRRSGRLLAAQSSLDQRFRYICFGCGVICECLSFHDHCLALNDENDFLLHIRSVSGHINIVKSAMK